VVSEYYACAVTPSRRLPTSPKALSLGLLAALVLASAGCAQGEIKVDSQYERGATLFNQRCSGCHTLTAANAYGSKPKGQLQGGERTNGPNFDVRKVNRDDALFAIRNGGFSGAIMPANVVVGKDAEAVAQFLAKYSGKKGK
jgi:mono/diheme cytochrome c family protein